MRRSIRQTAHASAVWVHCNYLNLPQAPSKSSNAIRMCLTPDSCLSAWLQYRCRCLHSNIRASKMTTVTTNKLRDLVYRFTMVYPLAWPGGRDKHSQAASSVVHPAMSQFSWHGKSTFISPTQAAHVTSTVLASVGLPIGALLRQHNLPRPCGGMILVGRNQFQSLQCITMMGIGCNKPVSIWKHSWKGLTNFSICQKKDLRILVLPIPSNSNSYFQLQNLSFLAWNFHVLRSIQGWLRGTKDMPLLWQEILVSMEPTGRP